MKSYYSLNGEKISLSSKPIATAGGEGAVYAIISPAKYNGYCAKIYHNKHLGGGRALRERKLKYMVNNVPKRLKDKNYIVCWPTDVLYEKSGKKDFSGFIMPLAFNNSILLYDICQLKIKNKNHIWEAKYSRKNKDGLVARIKLCVNIAIAVSVIHSIGSYTIVDLKPQNILITDDGRISIIDLDSIQINDPKKILVLNASVSTPGYIPPEGKKVHPSKEVIKETWDRFALGVIFYEIIFGIHPFAVTPKAGYSKGTTIQDNISSGLFPFGSNSSKIQISPQVHSKFSKLPKSLQTLFKKNFDTGLKQPKARPKPEEWGKVLFSLVKGIPAKKVSKSSRKAKHQPSTATGNKKRSKKTTLPRKRTNKPLIPIQATVNTSVSVNHTTFAKVLKNQIFARGMYEIDKNEVLPRRKVYFYSFVYSISAFVLGGLLNVPILNAAFGQFTCLLGLFISHIIGTLDVFSVFLFNKYFKSKSP